MKHTTGPRRGRPRGNGKRFSSSGKNQTFESSGPEVKIRGTAQQVYEKYLSLARDALSAGDRILAEGYFQFADHYFRIVTAANGNAQARSDRNANIPPPPESAAGQIVVEDGETDRAEGVETEPEDTGDSRDVEGAEGADREQRRVGGRLGRRSRPAGGRDRDESQVVERFAEEVKGAEPESQAEELAQALSRGDGGAETQQGSEDAAPDGAAKRRRRSPLGIGRKRPVGRPRKQAESEGGAATDEAADDAGVVKTVRRGARKSETKAPDPATENA